MASKSRLSIPTEAKGALSRRGVLRRTKGGHIGKTSAAEPKTDWARLRGMSDQEIRRGIKSDPEIHSTDRKFWKKAKVVMPRRKEVVTIRLDADLLDWLRRESGYQTRVNAVLRAYMGAHEGVVGRGE